MPVEIIQHVVIDILLPKFGGAGGTVNLTSQTGTVNVSSTIETSSNDLPQRRRSAKGGTIQLRSNKTAGTAINISSSAQLKSLLDVAAPGPGGKITFTSAGGDISVNGSVVAERGLVDIRNNGPSGMVAVTDASIRGDTVKIGALGDNGALNIGRSTITADTTMRLYAGGTNGAVNFTDNVTLSGASTKTIAGRTVNITSGKTVTVTAPAASSML